VASDQRLAPSAVISINWQNFRHNKMLVGSQRLSKTSYEEIKSPHFLCWGNEHRSFSPYSSHCTDWVAPASLFIQCFSIPKAIRTHMIISANAKIPSLHTNLNHFHVLPIVTISFLRNILTLFSHLLLGHRSSHHTRNKQTIFLTILENLFILAICLAHHSFVDFTIIRVGDDVH
jgi:hypothetical protein